MTMATIESRLQALERQIGVNPNMLRGWIDLAPGQTPLEALEGRGPGLWFLIDEHLNGPGYLGRVSASGKRAIIYVGVEHANH
jgi:hypothetical protein